ncbi:proteasome activator [Brevibacterium atlanticum]|uniref:proteasome activator n=1 Tax=Brevibacterium atlanticum TaxID=2697563 RepID=UPI00141E53B1|nr:proteasome activator [Brevibacterium atlanticum]
MTESPEGSPAGAESADTPESDLARTENGRAEKDQADVSSPAKVMRIGTMVKQLLEEVRSTDLDEKGRQRLAEIHRRSIEELEDGLSKDLIDELERLDLPFDSTDGPPTTSELRIAQAQLVGWLEGLFHGIQTAIMAQQAMAQQAAGRGQLPPGMVAPGMTPPESAAQGSEKQESEQGDRGTGNYL